jgi:hypothetical protein
MRHVSIINLNANYFYLRFVYFGSVLSNVINIAQQKRLHSAADFGRIQTLMRMIRIIDYLETT